MNHEDIVQDADPDETTMQIYIRHWVKEKTDLLPSFFHFENEGKSSWVRGKLQKKMGVVSGVSDIFISRSNASYKGIWIELKKKGKKPTKEQKDFMEQMRSDGYYTTWCDTIDAAIQEIKLFYSIS